MSLNQAKRIIKQEITVKAIKVIEFHGGEPLLSFPLIKDICEWFWQTYPDLQVKFFLTTNGTQFTESIKKWFEINHKKIVCSLSLDGTPKMNLTNRGCIISDDILSFMNNLWPLQSIKMTISLATLPSLSEGVIYAHEHNFRISANLAYGIDWTKSDIQVYERELQRLVDYYKVHPELEPCSILNGDKLIKILMPYSLKRHCQAGQTYHAYDIDGQRYPCQVFAGNTLKADQWKSISDTDFKDDKLFDDPECKDCPIHNICSTCFGMNFIERGCINSRDKAMCDFIKAEKLATCRLYKHKILAKDIDSVTEKEYLILKAIQKLSEYYPI